MSEQLKRQFKTCSLWPLAVLVLWLSGCGANPNYAPVWEHSERPLNPPASHTVSPGETLYAIAWRYGMDFRGLASANNIDPPYTIYPGQELVLEERSVAAEQQRGGASGSSSQQARTDPGRAPSPARRKGAADSSVADGNAAKSNRLEGWRWPAGGPVLERYSRARPAHKGIDIGGELGQPVTAANSGRVVYAGSGLVGYGNLIIIKHDDVYLSAYGHNRRLLVKEGQRIKVGQRIAEIGDTGTNSVKLHFEIRRDGQPVDPMQLLPER